MESWSSVASNNYGAAISLHRAGFWRSCISRAYYAAYTHLTGELIRNGVTMPRDRGNPSHASLPNLVTSKLTSRHAGPPRRLESLIRDLYKLRIMVDYRLDYTVERPEAHKAIGIMIEIFAGTHKGAQS